MTFDSLLEGFYEPEAGSIGRGAGTQTFKDETMANLGSVLSAI